METIEYDPQLILNSFTIKSGRKEFLRTINWK